MRRFKSFFAFSQNKKSATQPPRSRSELLPHSSPWTPAAYDASMVLEEEEEESEESEEDFEVDYVEYNDRLWGREWVPAGQQHGWWLAAADGSQGGHTIWRPPWLMDRGPGGRAWYDSGYMAYVSSWSLCRIFLLFYAKENLDPEVVCLALWRFGLRVTLNEKFAQSILQLPSSFSHLYSSRRNARFNSGICYASGPGVWTVFLVEVDSYPEVDSRPALLGPCSVEKCAQFRFWLLQLEHLEICTLFPRASRIWQSLHTVQFCVRKVFSCVSHRRGTGVAGSRDSQVTRYRYSGDVDIQSLSECRVNNNNMVLDYCGYGSDDVMAVGWVLGR